MELSIQDLNKSFNDNHVLKDVSFTVKSGQIFGYLGRNGAGKTTSIRILMDVFAADSGSITMDGQKFDPSAYKIGYLPEERGMYSKTTVKEQLIYFAMLRGASKKEASDSVEYWTKRFEIEEYLNRKVETLSKGNQQKVQITQAFLNEPDILILDEPFSGLDPVNSKVFQDALVDYIKNDKIIIFSSHQMTYVETFCDNIAIIDKGKIVLEGSLKAIKKELGAQKVRINSDDNTALEAYLAQTEYDLDTKGYVLDCGLDRKKFVQELVSQDFNITLFEDYTPTLQEIFIANVEEQV